MTTRIQDNVIKGVFLIILFTILLFQSLVTPAQSHRWDSQKPYKGFVASFGTKSGTIASDIAKINDNTLLQTGGEVGFIYGSSVVQSKVGLFGYYTSSENSAGTTDLYTSTISASFYPLALIFRKSTLVRPYLTGGLDYNRYKFYGFYLNHEPGTANYSQAEAPYLGAIKQLNATAGLGVTVTLKDRLDFVHLFSELKYGHHVLTGSKDSSFSATTLDDQTQIVFGVSFGAHR